MIALATRRVSTAPQVDLRTWQAVSEALQRDVLTGRLQPDERLVEDEVMARFGASRYAVRRSFEDLQALGLAIRMENRGTRIRGYAAQEVVDLYDLREILETAAAMRIAMPVPEAFVADLVRIQRQHDTAARKGDLLRMHVLNEQFHRAFFGATPNRLLRDAVAAHALQVQPVRIRFHNDARRRAEAAQEHWDMIDALQAGNNEQLAGICGRHLALSKAAYLKSEGARQTTRGDR